MGNRLKSLPSTETPVGVRPIVTRFHGTLERDDDGALLLDPDKVMPFRKKPGKSPFGNPRRRFRTIPELARSIGEVGQAEAGLVIVIDTPEFAVELVDGERRLKACKLAGRKFKAYPTTVRDPLEQFKISFARNFGSEAHDCLEVAEAIKTLADNGQSHMQIADTAGGKSITWVTQHLNLLKLHPDVQSMLVEVPDDDEDGDGTADRAIQAIQRNSKKRENFKLTFSLAQLLVPLPESRQLGVARHILAKRMTMDSARRYIFGILRESSQNGNGHAFAVPHRRPAKQFGSLQSLAARMRDKVGVFIDMHDEELSKVLADRPRPELVRILANLRQFQAELEVLTDSLTGKIQPTEAETAKIAAAVDNVT